MPRTLPQPDPPAFDSFRDLSERRTALVGVDLGRHGRSTPCVDALRSIIEILELDGDSSTHGVDPSDRGNLSEVGRHGQAGPLAAWMPPSSPMGEGALLAKHCFASARTHSRQRLGRTAERGLRRVLPVHAAPPAHGMPAFAVAVEVAGQRPALPGCRAQPCRKKTAGRGLLFRCNGAPGEIRTPDRLVRSQVLYPTELRAPIT